MQSKIFFILFLFPIVFYAQTEKDSVQKLSEVVVEARRISLPFIENSFSIEVMDSIEMLVFGKKSLDELLQNMNGIDVRRRGIEGMQSDLYIRGGNFEQVLILIDGVKMDDLQTGHHNMNAIIPVENIERIELIKGAASRIYGQNAMNGAINIITKKPNYEQTQINVRAGSFATYVVGVGNTTLFKDGNIQFSINKIQSDGYRYNTDFKNWNGFIKTNFKEYELLATYAERNFGANGFYASPLFKDQYEETATLMLALKRTFSLRKIKTISQVYWRNNTDMFLLKRFEPNFYKNEHSNNKYGLSLDGNYNSNWGITGIGIDMNIGKLESTNLGNHERFTSVFYLEQRFRLFDKKLDITPGISLNYYNDFGTFLYPGIDVGLKINQHWKTYANVGYTSRIPTFTNLYYKSSTEQGNPFLKPEKAITNEFGFYFTQSNILLQANAFFRHATDLIDWTKDTAADKWQARNFNKVYTNGVEFNGKYRYKLNEMPQFLKLAYTFMDEQILDQQVAFSRYSLNSFKHQVIIGWNTQFLKNIQHGINYRFVERTQGVIYQLVDANINYNYKNFNLGLQVNNLFDIDYTETNLVQMPGFNMALRLGIQL